MEALEEACVSSPDIKERVLAGFFFVDVSARMLGADLLRFCLGHEIDFNEVAGVSFVDVEAHVTKMDRARLETSRMGVASASQLGQVFKLNLVLPLLYRFARK